MLLTLMCCAVQSGCGKSLVNKGTEQLLASAAVDESVSRIDFTPLAGQTVYLDTQYVKPLKDGIGIVNSEYVISALRQQMVAANCLIQDKPEEASFIVEARVGALGTNQHEVVYGIPANNALGAVAALMPNMPATAPAIPEISLAKREHNSATAKVAVFAYHRETKQPVWQSGTAVANSNAKDMWLFGAGPFQSGTIYPETRLAGSKIQLPFQKREPAKIPPGVAFQKQHTFAKADAIMTEPPATQNVSKEPAASPQAPPPPPSDVDVVQQAKHESTVTTPSGVSPLNTTKAEFEEAMKKQISP